ncbi:phosphatase PAP2 family protein [Stappia albiluteola]|uniref:phosphatase PAP2 family protein n=1 Tax=Stappia albiluteola TaxID=2758565 RepID=UPI001AD8BC70|nr:phosphatase PAP2 family protein [Stappia albiluteola]
MIEKGAADASWLPVWKAKVAVLWATARRNGRNIAAILRTRRQRIRSVKTAARAGQRPQDLLAILLLTVGIAVIALDIPTYPWIHSMPAQYRDAFASFTHLGRADWILWSSGLFCLGMLLVDWQKLANRIRIAVIAAWTYAAFIFASVAVSGIIAVTIKWSLGRARPKLFPEFGPMEFRPFYFDSHFTSFPSGHSTTIAALATALVLLFPTWRWLTIVAAFWIAFSRIMIGAHYPSDVIAGTLLGITITLATARWMARRHIGFVLGPDNRLRPTIGRLSAKACAVALWQAVQGYRSAYRGSPSHSSSKTIENGDQE